MLEEKNDPKHCSKSTHRMDAGENEICLLEWPSQSPELRINASELKQFSGNYQVRV